MKKPEISVVVATCNRAEILKTTLQHLTNQSLDSEYYEIVIIDDGSIDNTHEIVEQNIRSGSHCIRYLQHENRGPGYSQNRGIRQANGTIILLIADDIFLTPEALKAHLDFHTEYPSEQTAVLGRVLQSLELNQTVFLRKWKTYRLDNIPDKQEMPYYMFWACNISFKRDFMLQHGMFRENLAKTGVAAHEDVELGYRLYKNGLKLIHCRQALGYHFHHTTLEHTIQRSYERGLNWYNFRKLVPESEIDLRYRVYNLKILVAYFIKQNKSAPRFLLGSDRSFIMLFIRYLIRSILFNRLTVPAFWIPVMKQAEKTRILEKCMIDNFYRGVILYHFLKGCRESRKISKI